MSYSSNAEKTQSTKNYTGSYLEEYYYDYFEYVYSDYPDPSNQSAVEVNGEVGEPSKRERRELTRNKKYSIEKKLNISLELKVDEKFNNVRRKKFEVDQYASKKLEIFFKIANFDVGSIGSMRYIECDLRPIESCESSQCRGNSKVAKYVGSLGSVVGKKIIVADVSLEAISPLSLTNFKCAEVKLSPGKEGNLYDLFIKSMNTEELTYLFVVCNTVCFFVVILLAKYMIKGTLLLLKIKSNQISYYLVFTCLF